MGHGERVRRELRKRSDGCRLRHFHSYDEASWMQRKVAFTSTPASNNRLPGTLEVKTPLEGCGFDLQQL